MKVEAKPYLDEADSVVAAGLQVASRVAAGLRESEYVVVSMDGVLAASSSFFNILFVEVRREFGLEALKTRLRIESDSQVLASLAARSLEAVTNADFEQSA